MLLTQVLFLSSQFNRYDPVDGRITERDFADILLLYAGLADKKRTRMLKRVRKAFKNAPQVCHIVTLHLMLCTYFNSFCKMFIICIILVTCANFVVCCLLWNIWAFCLSQIVEAFIAMLVYLAAQMWWLCVGHFELFITVAAK